MTFKTQLTDDLKNVFLNTDEFAESATYTPAGGTAKTISVIIDEGSGEGYMGADALDHAAIMRIMVSDISEVVAGDQVTCGSDIWEIVDGEKSADGLEWIATVSRMTR